MDDQELAAIVQNMLDAGESEENIATVIQAYPQLEQATPAEQPAQIPALAVGPGAAAAASTVRPAANAVGNRLAKTGGGTVVRLGGRVLGGALGAGAGAALGSGGGPFGMFSGGQAGAYIGNTLGAKAAGKVVPALKVAGKAIADATSTAPAEVIKSRIQERGPGGKWLPFKEVTKELPKSRKLIDALGKVVPALDRVSLLSSLYDQQPSDPNDNFLQSLVRKTPGVLKDPLGIATGSAPGPDGTFPVEHYKDDLIKFRDYLLEKLATKK